MPPLTKFRASQIFIEESCLRALLHRPVCQQPIDTRAVDESGRISSFTLVTHTRSRRWRQTSSLCGPVDWQPGELVAAGHSRSVALSPSANYTSHITGRGDGTDGGAQTDSLSKYRMTMAAECDALILQCDESSVCHPSERN